MGNWERETSDDKKKTQTLGKIKRKNSAFTFYMIRYTVLFSAGQHST